MNRRDFIRTASLLPFGAPAVAKIPPVLKTSLNAYSFNKLLNDAIRGRGEGTTLLKLADFAAKNKFDAFDPTGYFFPGYPAVPADAYVDSLKKRAADLGLGISGTGVRNNFTTSDKEVRDTGVKHIKEWVEVAARLGAPVIRVFADTQMRPRRGNRCRRATPGRTCRIGSRPRCRNAPSRASGTKFASACRITATF